MQYCSIILTGRTIVGCKDLPHVDEILGQGDTLRVATDGDGPVQVGGGISVLTVGDSDHCPGELSAKSYVTPVYGNTCGNFHRKTIFALKEGCCKVLVDQCTSQTLILQQQIPRPPDLCHLGAAFADDAADELIGHGHLMALLLAGVPGLPSQKSKS